MSEQKKISVRFGSKQLIPIVFAAFAMLFLWLGIAKYGFWDQYKGPMPGFMPIVISIALFVCSVLGFVFSFTEKSPSWPIENWYVVFSGVAIIAATYLIGLLPSLAMYVLLWLKWYEKCSWKTTLIVFAVVMAIVIGAFVLWLGVPFPKGILYNLIFY
ncbi:MAG: tripartite tricarboxylate transporter TctB family protein [Sphaerochaetaceae bacterium]